MLYGEYVVTDCGIREGNGQKVYFCKLLGFNDHKINFSLIIKGCVGEKEYLAQYESVAPHIHVGNLLYCEFAWRWHSHYLNLCLSGILHAKARGIGAGDTSAMDYINRGRGYWVTAETVGSWVHFPELINCGGDAFVHTNFEKAIPQFSSFDASSVRGELVWKPKSKKTSRYGKNKTIFQQVHFIIFQGITRHHHRFPEAVILILYQFFRLTTQFFLFNIQ